MSDTKVDPAGVDGNNTGGTSTGDGGFKPITSQDEFNRIIAERVSRERGKFADYDDLKAKAARLAQIEEANKSEADKFNERIAALEQENEAIKSQALKSRIQAKFSVSDEDAELFLTGTDEATLTKQAERLAQRAADRKKHGNYVAREGDNNSTAKDDPMREVARRIFKRDD